jgi:hypothetical protein
MKELIQYEVSSMRRTASKRCVGKRTQKVVLEAVEGATSPEKPCGLRLS